MRKVITVCLLGAALACTIDGLNSSPGGTPQPASGGPAESGGTCFRSNCHVGAPSTVTNIITTNVPAAGYNPGETYTINLSVNGTGHKGFQVSVQKSDGQYAGVLTAGAGSWIPFANYITHSNTIFPSPGTWSFTWQAPAAGTGTVNIHGAFAITRNVTRQQTLAIMENPTAGVDDLFEVQNLSLYPNPVSDKILVSFHLKQKAGIAFNLLSLDGRLVASLGQSTATTGAQSVSLGVESVPVGLYLLEMRAENQTHYEKVLVSR